MINAPNFSLNFLLSLLMAFTPAAYPHGSHNDHQHHSACGHSCSHGREIDPLRDAEQIELTGLSDTELRELMDAGHHALENDDLTAVQKLTEKVNFKKIALSAYRWASINEDRPELANARANIATMLITSHLVETVGGVSMVVYALANGLETAAQKAMFTTGMAMPIPSLDPLCFVLMIVYGAFPRTMNSILAKPRVYVLRGAKAANAMIGMPEGWLSSATTAISKQRFLQRYLGGGDVYSHRVIFDEYQFQIHGTQEGQTIELTMKRQPSGILALTKVRFSERAPAMVRSYIGQLLKPFGWNIKSLVLEVDKAIADGKFEGLAKQSYIEKVDPLSDRYTVILKPGAFPFHNLHESDFNCEAQLMAKRAATR